jgi:hypothetical protein
VNQFGLHDVPVEGHCVEWDVEGDAPAEGASFQLALAVATAAALTGAKAPRVIVAGAVDGDQAGPVEGLEEMATLLLKAPPEQAKRWPFERLVLPEANWQRLPASAKREHFYVENRPFRCVGVASVADAVREALGGPLGAPVAALDRLAGAVRRGAEQARVELWVEPDAAPAARDMVLRREGGKAGYRWRVGDRLRVRTRADRDCYLALFNVNPAGQVTVLLPNDRRRVAPLRAGEAAAFPTDTDDMDFELQPPTGAERMVAVVTARPLPLAPHDLGQDEALLCARLTLSELEALAEQFAPYVVGEAETDFQVEEAPPGATRGGPARGGDEEEGWAAFELG